jgi:pterin-4a-carbinolamine dehydratase
MPELTTKLKAERIQQTLEAGTLQEKLKAERIQERLAALPGWDTVRDGTALRRRLELPTVRAASLFATLAAEIGAATGVHPAIRLHGREVTLTIAGGSGPGEGESEDDGLSDLDFDVAELLTLPALAPDPRP